MAKEVIKHKALMVRAGTHKVVRMKAFDRDLTVDAYINKLLELEKENDGEIHNRNKEV